MPCNMVSEIQVDDEETRDQLLQQGFLPTENSIGKIGTLSWQCFSDAERKLCWFISYQGGRFVA